MTLSPKFLLYCQKLPLLKVNRQNHMHFHHLMIHIRSVGNLSFRQSWDVS